MAYRVDRIGWVRAAHLGASAGDMVILARKNRMVYAGPICPAGIWFSHCLNCASRILEGTLPRIRPSIHSTRDRTVANPGPEESAGPLDRGLNHPASPTINNTAPTPGRIFFHIAEEGIMGVDYTIIAVHNSD